MTDEATYEVSVPAEVSVLALTTRFQHTVQLLLCDGCCCGKTEQGHPAVPFAALLKQWQRQKLWHLHLTPCHCLGPCDVPNVVCVLSGAETAWFGKLETEADYSALLEWASALGSGCVKPLPAELDGKRLER